MDNPGFVIDKKNQSVLSLNHEPFNTSSTQKLTDSNGKALKSSKLNPDMYDPFSNRDMTHATPDTGALLHLLKSSLGSGILAMPNAFKNGGLGFGVIGTIIVGIICTHCVQMLVWCSQVLSVRVKRPSLGFAETAEVAFQTGPPRFKTWATFAREFVNTSLFCTYYFGNTVYVVFVASSFKQVIDMNANIDLNIRLYILLLAIPLVPLGIIRTLKYLVPFSALATAFIMFGLAITLWYTLTDLPPLETRHQFSSIAQLPLFFSTVLFAMEGIGTVLPIENSMKNPEHFLGCPGVLNIAMTVVVCLYAFVGFCGYLKYGEETRGSVTLNLPYDLLGESVKILVALSILFTYGLQFTVPSEIVWKKISHKIKEENHNKCYYIMRACMILGTVVIAIALPDLEPFISLVGAICFSILGLLCPAVIEIATFWEEPEYWGFLRWRLLKNYLLCLLSVFALVSGTYASVRQIIDSYQHGEL
ncbi:proton-coupled amino acid transporter-like protein pathetic [Macrosteles quadrilineatus]|uniref:proton-coupled amino acid transporter-like protein pathetic n=1 Tax=Macrosteles quadrilineatus TaxID=74068 RepID=UPI0023E175C0|nr:proton-coupled amino acid transporter-like protein pathetic [Macrosteles quadrilineatus]XP_054269597.1 proton-coupled amino acid transporter-like protein pathetic [Macrosteles quadrilineatus]XP_054269598.1 proton-coupled amino acid transporter-like protein pathetic [Macrosteles quadrilineatus]